jgi:bifunctional UDP-N-acetylglucosamine pyrophosphorylase/glucosamine-1-phosphate N-acetyltransferase
MNSSASIILAAGEGTRMKSDLPKVLHQVSGKPMIEWVLDTVLKAGYKENYVIVGYKKEKVIEALNKSGYNNGIIFIEQKERLGSGHAVLQAKKYLKDSDKDVLVTCADVPLLSTGTLNCLMKTHLKEGNDATVLTADIDNAFGYGRIIKENGTVRIVEERDATAQERAVKKINTGIYCFKSGELFEALEKVTQHNSKNEYYLTDVFKILSEEGKKTGIATTANYRETAGVNTVEQLKEAEKYLEELSKSRRHTTLVDRIDGG